MVIDQRVIEIKQYATQHARQSMGERPCKRATRNPSAASTPADVGYVREFGILFREW
ncbi:hypothetical protein Aab01nite_32270 [Paractinoplanes abujensis]|nr:hypothetical protein Aab01nite_32270 [Actinoplanes abujensis]